MDDTFFEAVQTGLSRMWTDTLPAYVDPRMGRPAMQPKPPLPFQSVTEPPSEPGRTNTDTALWESSAFDLDLRGRGPVSSTARRIALHQSTLRQPAPGEAIRTANPIPPPQGYSVQQSPFPGPLTLPTRPIPVPVAYDITQHEQPPAQAISPGPILVQLGASQNFLVNNRPAPWIQVLDVDPSYQHARAPSPHRAPAIALSIYVRAPETEHHYWAVFLRELTVQEAIARVVQKYGFSDAERDRVRGAVRVTDDGGVWRLVDADVRLMQSGVAIDVKVTSCDARSEDWQLELRY